MNNSCLSSSQSEFRRNKNKKQSIPKPPKPSKTKIANKINKSFGDKTLLLY